MKQTLIILAILLLSCSKSKSTNIKNEFDSSENKLFLSLKIKFIANNKIQISFHNISKQSRNFNIPNIIFYTKDNDTRDSKIDIFEINCKNVISFNCKLFLKSNETIVYNYQLPMNKKGKYYLKLKEDEEVKLETESIFIQ